MDLLLRSQDLHLHSVLKKNNAYVSNMNREKYYRGLGNLHIDQVAEAALGELLVLPEPDEWEITLDNGSDPRV